MRTVSVLLFRRKSIQAKIIFWALLPCILVMAGITLLALITIKNTALEVVTNRDMVLAELAAKRLAENLQKYPLFLQTIAENSAIQTMDSKGQEALSVAGRSWLHFFDGGIVLFDSEGRATLTTNDDFSFSGSRFPDMEGFHELRRSYRPYFSDTLLLDDGRTAVIVIAIPVLSPDNAFIGALAGICSVNRSTIGTTYSQVLEYESGKSSFAYLVDGEGVVLYHRHSSLIGNRVENYRSVENVTLGQRGAMMTEDSSGQPVISGFAPVPGTSWGVVTQGNWELISNMIRFYTRFFQFILWGGGLVIALLVVLFIQRLLEPIRQLTKGAELIADGQFIEIPVKKTNDEIEVLSKQFNSMARAMKASFFSAEHRIKELNRIKDELTQSEAQIKGIINSVKDILFMVDNRGKVLWVNDKGREIFGDTMEGRWYWQVLYGQDEEASDCFIRAFINGASEENDRELKIQVDGRAQDYWCTVNAVQPEERGGVGSAVVVCRNMTEKKQLRAEVLRNAQLAALGELAAGIAHEINNPITGIINYAQIISDSWEPKDNRHAQLPGWIMQEGERIAIIVSKLLSFARRDVERKRPVFIREVLQDVLNLTGTLLKKEQVSIELDIPESLPPVRAVIHQLQQIILNILSNARYALNEKYPGSHEQKKISISARTSTESGRGMVHVEFMDFGTGIAKEILDKVCNPFFSTKAPEQGTGLGLSISFGIIEEHHGELTVESVEGQWTRVAIDLPVWRKEEEESK